MIEETSARTPLFPCIFEVILTGEFILNGCIGHTDRNERVTDKVDPHSGSVGSGNGEDRMHGFVEEIELFREASGFQKGRCGAVENFERQIELRGSLLRYITDER